MDMPPSIELKVVTASSDGVAPALLLTVRRGRLHTTPIQYLVNAPEGFSRLVLEHRCRPGPGLRAALLTDLSQAAMGGLAGLLLRLRQDGHSRLRLLGPAGLRDAVDGLSYFVRWTHPALDLSCLTAADQGVAYEDDTVEVRPLWGSCLLWQVPAWLEAAAAAGPAAGAAAAAAPGAAAAREQGLGGTGSDTAAPGMGAAATAASAGDAGPAAWPREEGAGTEHGEERGQEGRQHAGGANPRESSPSGQPRLGQSSTAAGNGGGGPGVLSAAGARSGAGSGAKAQAQSGGPPTGHRAKRPKLTPAAGRQGAGEGAAPDGDGGDDDGDAGCGGQGGGAALPAAAAAADPLAALRAALERTSAAAAAAWTACRAPRRGGRGGAAGGGRRGRGRRGAPSGAAAGAAAAAGTGAPVSRSADGAPPRDGAVSCGDELELGRVPSTQDLELEAEPRVWESGGSSSSSSGGSGGSSSGVTDVDEGADGGVGGASGPLATGGLPAMRGGGNGSSAAVAVDSGDGRRRGAAGGASDSSSSSDSSSDSSDQSEEGRDSKEHKRGKGRATTAGSSGSGTSSSSTSESSGSGRSCSSSDSSDGSDSGSDDNNSSDGKGPAAKHQRGKPAAALPAHPPADLFAELDRLFLANANANTGASTNPGTRRNGNVPFTHASRAALGRPTASAFAPSAGRGRSGRGARPGAGAGAGAAAHGAGGAGAGVDAALRSAVLAKLRLKDATGQPPPQAPSRQPSRQQQAPELGKPARQEGGRGTGLRTVASPSNGGTTGRTQTGATAVAGRAGASVPSRLGAGRALMPAATATATAAAVVAAAPAARPVVQPPLGYLLYVKATRQALLVAAPRDAADADALAAHPAVQLLAAAAPTGLLLAAAHLTPAAVARRASYRRWVRSVRALHVWCGQGGGRAAGDGGLAGARDTGSRGTDGGGGAGGRVPQAHGGASDGDAAIAGVGGLDAAHGDGSQPPESGNGMELTGRGKLGVPGGAALEDYRPPRGLGGPCPPPPADAVASPFPGAPPTAPLTLPPPAVGPVSGLGHLASCRVTARLNLVAPALFPLPFVLRRGRHGQGAGAGVGPGSPRSAGIAGGEPANGRWPASGAAADEGPTHPDGAGAGSGGKDLCTGGKDLCTGGSRGAEPASLSQPAGDISGAGAEAPRAAVGTGQAAAGSTPVVPPRRGHLHASLLSTLTATATACPGAAAGAANGHRKRRKKAPASDAASLEEWRPAAVAVSWCQGLPAWGAATGAAGAATEGAARQAGGGTGGGAAALEERVLPPQPGPGPGPGPCGANPVVAGLQCELLWERRSSGLAQMLQALRSAVPDLTQPAEAHRLLRPPPAPSRQRAEQAPGPAADQAAEPPPAAAAAAAAATLDSSPVLAPPRAGGPLASVPVPSAGPDAYRAPTAMQPPHDTWPSWHPQPQHQQGPPLQQQPHLYSSSWSGEHAGWPGPSAAGADAAAEAELAAAAAGYGAAELRGRLMRPMYTAGAGPGRGPELGCLEGANGRDSWYPVDPYGHTYGHPYPQPVQHSGGNGMYAGQEPYGVGPGQVYPQQADDQQHGAAAPAAAERQQTGSGVVAACAPQAFGAGLAAPTGPLAAAPAAPANGVNDGAIGAIGSGASMGDAGAARGVPGGEAPMGRATDNRLVAARLRGALEAGRQRASAGAAGSAGAGATAPELPTPPGQPSSAGAAAVGPTPQDRPGSGGEACDRGASGGVLGAELEASNREVAARLRRGVRGRGHTMDAAAGAAGAGAAAAPPPAAAATDAELHTLGTHPTAAAPPTAAHALVVGGAGGGSDDGGGEGDTECWGDDAGDDAAPAASAQQPGSRPTDGPWLDVRRADEDEPPAGAAGSNRHVATRLRQALRATVLALVGAATAGPEGKTAREEAAACEGPDAAAGARAASWDETGRGGESRGGEDGTEVQRSTEGPNAPQCPGFRDSADGDSGASTAGAAASSADGNREAARRVRQRLHSSSSVATVAAADPAANPMVAEGPHVARRRLDPGADAAAALGAVTPSQRGPCGLDNNDNAPQATEQAAPCTTNAADNSGAAAGEAPGGEGLAPEGGGGAGAGSNWDVAARLRAALLRVAGGAGGGHRARDSAAAARGPEPPEGPSGATTPAPASVAAACAAAPATSAAGLPAASAEPPAPAVPAASAAAVAAVPAPATIITSTAAEAAAADGAAACGLPEAAAARLATYTAELAAYRRETASQGAPAAAAAATGASGPAPAPAAPDAAHGAAASTNGSSTTANGTTHGTTTTTVAASASASLPALPRYVALLFLGTGSAEPSKYRGASGVLLRGLGPTRGSLLIDCGEGTFGALVRWLGHRGAVAEAGALSLVWLSHKHPDHVLGLPALLEARPPACPPLLVVGPQEVSAWLSRVAPLHPSWRFTFLHCADFVGEAPASAPHPAAAFGTSPAEPAQPAGGPAPQQAAAPPPPQRGPTAAWGYSAGLAQHSNPVAAAPDPWPGCNCCPPFAGFSPASAATGAAAPTGPAARRAPYPWGAPGSCGVGAPPGGPPPPPPQPQQQPTVAGARPPPLSTSAPPPAARLRWHQQRRAHWAQPPQTLPPPPPPPPCREKNPLPPQPRAPLVQRAPAAAPPPHQQRQREGGGGGRVPWQQWSRDAGVAAAAAACASLGLVRWRSVGVHHCRDAWGLVVTAAEGWKLVYSGDTRPCPALVSAGSGATLLVHEATFEPCLQAQARIKRHCTSAEAAQVAEAMGAYRTVLTHFSQRYPHLPAGLDPWVSPPHRRPLPAFDGLLLPLAALPALPLLLPPLAEAIGTAAAASEEARDGKGEP